MHAYGQFHAPESPNALLRLHRHAGETLREVDHEPKMAVLDQEDLFAQGIDTSTLIPGAKRMDALGSCTANATVAHLSLLMDRSAFAKWLANGASAPVNPYSDTVAGEEAAIRFYHGCTDQTGQSDQEWPPTDCGSSGPYVFKWAKHLGFCSSEKIAHGAQDLVSLLQLGSVLVGGPFLNAWEEPDAQGFVDGDGSTATLERQIGQGVAGGHERVIVAIEHLELTETGVVIPEKTILRDRNSWSARWGDHGDYRVHLSTYVALGAYNDYRQLVA